MIRRPVVIAAAVVIAIAAAAALIATRIGADPTEQVAPVSVPGVTVAPAPDGTPSGGSQQHVDGLDRLTGELLAEDDPGEYRLGTVDLDFGPDTWILTAPALADYDGDGRNARLEDELNALVGKPVRLLVRLDDGDDAVVYAVNDHPYRDPAGPAPWVPATPSPADRAPVTEVRAAAAAAVGAGARVDELVTASVGEVAWEATVTRADDAEFLVLLDAGGAVLAVRRE